MLSSPTVCQLYFPIVIRGIARFASIGFALAIACTLALALDRDRNIAQFYYSFWSAKDGAPSEISTLAQTEDGYLWIGSARGLFRFDGVKFEEYKPQPGTDLPSHSIYSLMATPDGGLWIAFEPNGVGFLKDGSLTVFKRREELPNSPIHCFARDDDGRIWGGTETGLVLRQGTRWIPVGSEWNFTPEMIRYLFVDREGKLWVATVKRVTYLRRGAAKFEPGGPVGTGITTLAQAKDGRVWFADDGSFEVRPVPIGGKNSNTQGPSVVADDLQELLVDRDGALWITRMDSGIVRIRYPEKLGKRKYGAQDPEFESIGAKEGFSGGSAYDLLEDHEGNIWIGCSNGLIRLRNNQLAAVRLPQGYERLTLFAGRNNDLWAGTIKKRPLLHIRGESYQFENVVERVSSVLRASNGDIWWGSRDRIWRMRGSTFTYFQLPSAATPDWMWDMMPSVPDGGLWVNLGDVGFVHFNQGIWDLNAWPRGAPPLGGTLRDEPSATYYDASGRFWLGYTSGQLYVLNEGNATAYSEKDGLDLGRIKVIRGLGKRIWVGGELGLAFFNKGRFWRVEAADGEPLGAVSGIIETPENGLWLNEMKGVVQIPSEEINRTIADPNHPVSYRRFDFLDGLPGSPQMSFTNSTAVRTSDGRLWFATANGLAWIDPAHRVKNLIPPPVSILSISNGRDRKLISNPIRFSAGTHNVEIDYAGLSLSIPERVQFRYRLDSIDADWQNVGTRRQAYYSNLGPGSYRFWVTACNNDGVWNDNGALIVFSIAPAYYQSLWFRSMFLIALVVLCWTLYQRRLKQLHRQFNLTLDARVDERTSIARELHDTLLQSLHGLMLRLQVVNEMLPQGKAKEQLEQSLERADGAIAEGRSALYALRSSATATNDLAQALRTLGEELATEDTAFHLLVEGTARDLHPIVRDEVYRIAREALRNAFSHAQARHIETEITYEERVFRLRFRDDGKGIPPDILDEGRSGHYGLVGMRERACKIGAELSIWSGAGAGTEIELTIARSMVYLSKSDRWRLGLFRKKPDET
jgi:signal transduction histidine kinase/ligand-binding sensor domain-containing protein